MTTLCAAKIFRGSTSERRIANKIEFDKKTEVSEVSVKLIAVTNEIIIKDASTKYADKINCQERCSRDFVLSILEEFSSMIALFGTIQSSLHSCF